MKITQTLKNGVITAVRANPIVGVYHLTFMVLWLGVAASFEQSSNIWATVASGFIATLHMIAIITILFDYDKIVREVKP